MKCNIINMKFFYTLKILLFLIILNGYYGIVLTLTVEKNKNITLLNVNNLKLTSIPSKSEMDKFGKNIKENDLNITIDSYCFKNRKNYSDAFYKKFLTAYKKLKGNRVISHESLKYDNHKIKRDSNGKVFTFYNKLFKFIIKDNDTSLKNQSDDDSDIVYYIDELDGMYPDNNDENFRGSTSFFLVVAFSMLLLMGGALRVLTKKPQYVLISMLFVGWLVSLVAMKIGFEPISHVDSFIMSESNSPYIICIVFIPMNVFYRGVTINIHEIKKCLGQIMLVSIFGFLFQVSVMALLIKKVDSNLKENYHWPAALLFGAFCAPTDPAVMTQLKTGHSKVLVPLLEGESLVTMCLSVSAFRITIEYISKLTTNSSFTDLAFGMMLSNAIQILSGVLLGLLTGYFIRFIWSRTKGDALAEACVTIGCSFCIFGIGMTNLWTSGVAGVTTLSIMLQRGTILSKTTVNMWMWVDYILNIILMFWVGLTCALVHHESTILEWLSVILFYFITYIVRGFTFALLKPLLASMGYGMSWQEATVATLGGIKQGSVTLPLAFACRAIYHKERHFFNTLVVVYMSGIFVLSFLINGTIFGPLVRYLQVEKVTLAKKGNMSRAVDYLLNTRQRTLDTLKLDRTTADANWLIVANCTLIKHPYTTAVEVEDETHPDFLRRRGSATKRKSLLSYKDSQMYKGSRPATLGLTTLYHEQMREANRRVLKVKRVLCTKQYENNYISHDVLCILYSAIDTAADRRRAQTNLDDIRKYWTPKKYLLYLRKKVFTIFSLYNKDLYFKPRNRIRAYVFSIVMWRYYELIMFIVLFFNLLTEICEHLLYKHIQEHIISLTVNNAATVIYIIDLMMKLIAYGFKPWARSYVCRIDLVSCIASIVHISFHNVLYISDVPFFETTGYGLHFYLTLNWVTTIIKTIRCIIYLYLVISQAGVTISSLIEAMIDRQLLLGYEIGRAYLSVLEDLEKKYNQVMDDPDIIETVRTREQREKYQLNHEMGLLQRDRPMLAITIKTRLAIMTIMKEMTYSVDVLFDDGLLDASEHELLMQSIEECYYLLSKVGMVQPCPPDVILRGVSWLMGEDAICDFLLSKAEIVSFNFDEYIIVRGEKPKGIYILLSGLTKTMYEPSVECIENWHEYGTLPNCDFLIHLDFAEIQHDIVVSGNVIGELGLFTSDPYEYTVTCVAGVQAFYFSSEVMNKALKITPAFGYNLEMRIWKTIAIRTAMLIVSHVPHFHSWTKDRLKLHLQRGFVPFIEPLENIPVTDIIEDIFLIQGVIYDAKTGNKYTAPCYIPITIKLLLLSEPHQKEHHSHRHQEYSAPVRLFIVPIEGITELSVMNSLANRQLTSKRSGFSLSLRDRTLTGADEHIIQSLRRRFKSRVTQLDEAEDGTGELSTDRFGRRVVPMTTAQDIEDNISDVEEDEEVIVFMKYKGDALNK